MSIATMERQIFSPCEGIPYPGTIAPVPVQILDKPRSMPNTTFSSNNLQIGVIHDPGVWGSLISRAKEGSIYLSVGWGAYKERQGWSVRRLAAGSALAQVQTKNATPFGPAITLIQGGPVFSEGDDQDTMEATLAAILASDGGHGMAVQVIQPGSAISPQLELLLAKQEFRVAPTEDSDTFSLNLTKSDDELRGALSKNWRHNLKRAENRGLEVRWINTDPEARRQATERLAKFYDALTRRKSFASALDPVALGACFHGDANLDMLEVVLNGNVLASRAVYHGGHTTLDLLAASSEGSRNTYANYLAVWSMIQRARAKGAARFDCGGIDPKGNPGVYNFKKGLGGEEVSWGRLWLRTRPAVLWHLAAKRIAG